MEHEIRHPLLRRLAGELRAGGPPAWTKPRVELMLGNDREIGRESRTQERRVGIVPDQVRDLRGFCAALQLDVDVLVLEGAGQRAGHADAHFVEAGAEIVTREELAWHDGPPDVFHALKEPSRYEAEVPAPFCRIGALHSGDFGPETGLAGLLLSRSVAVFDGSNIGAAGRIPIRGRMSEFAGRIGAGWIVEHLALRNLSGPVVVVGGGRAGNAAVEDVLLASDRVTAVRLLDLPRAVEALEQRYAGEERVQVRGRPPEEVDDPVLLEALDGAVGLLFAVAVRKGDAPKVASVEALDRLDGEAMVVDISIDEKGAVLDPAIPPAWTHERIIPHLERRLLPRLYRAIANMPRARPRQASEAHGEVILPYLAALLVLSARHGGPEGLVTHLRTLPARRDNPAPEEVPDGRVLEALAQDLRNGLAFWPCKLEAVQTTRRLAVGDTVADRRGVLGFLFDHAVPCEFSIVPRKRKDLTEAQIATVKTGYDRLPAPIRNCLTFAVERGLDGWVIHHPDIDGTHSEHAAFALGVDVASVLKCMILRTADGRYLAAVCEGDRRLDLDRIARLADSDKVEMASKREVYRVTQHPAGGIPLVEIFHMEALDRVLVSEGVMEHRKVVGSAGSEFIGMQVEPRVLVELGGEVASITA